MLQSEEGSLLHAAPDCRAPPDKYTFEALNLNAAKFNYDVKGDIIIKALGARARIRTTENIKRRRSAD